MSTDQSPLTSSNHSHQSASAGERIAQQAQQNRHRFTPLQENVQQQGNLPFQKQNFPAGNQQRTPQQQKDYMSQQQYQPHVQQPSPLSQQFRQQNEYIPRDQTNSRSNSPNPVNYQTSPQYNQQSQQSPQYGYQNQQYNQQNDRKPATVTSDEQIHELKHDIYKLRSENEHLRDFVEISKENANLRIGSLLATIVSWFRAERSRPRNGEHIDNFIRRNSDSNNKDELNAIKKAIKDLSQPTMIANLEKMTDNHLGNEGVKSLHKLQFDGQTPNNQDHPRRSLPNQMTYGEMEKPRMDISYSNPPQQSVQPKLEQFATPNTSETTPNVSANVKPIASSTPLSNHQLSYLPDNGSNATITPKQKPSDVISNFGQGVSNMYMTPSTVPSDCLSNFGNLMSPAQQPSDMISNFGQVVSNMSIPNAQLQQNPSDAYINFGKGISNASFLPPTQPESRAMFNSQNPSQQNCPPSNTGSQRFDFPRTPHQGSSNHGSNPSNLSVPMDEGSDVVNSFHAGQSPQRNQLSLQPSKQCNTGCNSSMCMPVSHPISPCPSDNTPRDISDMPTRMLAEENVSLDKRLGPQDGNDCSPVIQTIKTHNGKTITFKPTPRLIGEIVYQLDRRILNYVFNPAGLEKKRFYGYTIQNIPVKINRLTCNSKSKAVDEKDRDDLLRRYEDILDLLRKTQYRHPLHSDIGADLVNRFGLLSNIGDLENLGYKDHHVFENMLRLTAPPDVLSVIITILDCVTTIAKKDQRPIIAW